MWSQVCGKITILVNKVTLIKKEKKITNTENLKLEKTHFLKATFGTQFFQKSQTTLSKQFSLNYFFFGFLFKAHKFLETCANCV